MNVHEISESFHTMVENIATSNQAEYYVTKDLFQTCMASVSNTMIQLVPSVNQLTWGFYTGIGELSAKFENLEENNKSSCKNTAELSDEIQKLENNNSFLHKSIQKLSYKLGNVDSDSAHAYKITKELCEKVNRSEESCTNIQSHTKGISIRLENTELTNTQLQEQKYKTIQKMSQLEENSSFLKDNLSSVCESVSGLETCAATIMSNIQNNKQYIENLLNSVDSLGSKQSKVISHSIPKPPPGSSQYISPNSPFFIPHSAPGFVNPIIPPMHSSLSPDPMGLHTQLNFINEVDESVQVLSDHSNVAAGTEFSGDWRESLVSQDIDGSTGLSPAPLSDSKTDSFTAVTSSPSQHEKQPALDLFKLQTLEAKMANSCPTSMKRSDPHLLSLQNLHCETTEISQPQFSFNSVDSGIKSMLNFTSQQHSWEETSSPYVNDNAITDKVFYLSEPLLDSSQIKTEEECKQKPIYNLSHQHDRSQPADSAVTTVSHSFILTSGFKDFDALQVLIRSILKFTSAQNTTDETLDQSLDSPSNLFKQAKQSDGHIEYGRLHPVRRPWKIMYHYYHNFHWDLMIIFTTNVTFLKCLIFDVFSLLEIRKRKSRSHGIKKTRNSKRNKRAVKRSNTSLKDLSKVIEEYGRYSMLSFLSSLPISVLRILETEANKFDDRNHQL